MASLTVMRGYSGSGKSTRAAEIARDTGAVVVNRDLIRLMLLGTFWTGKKDDEDRVSLAEEAQVDAFLRQDTSVVVDATHLQPAYLRKWARLATRLGVEFQVEDVHADVDECKRRDHARMLAGGRYVGDAVIDRQAKKWPAHKWPTITAEPFVVEPVEPYVKLGLSTVIVDIDGTLAHYVDRSPYDYSRVGEDRVDIVIRELVNKLARAGYVIIVVSGRDDTCRADTVTWLHQNRIDYDLLYMRPADAKDERGNKLPDYKVKYNIFNEHIRGSHNVAFVLDDRTQVVEMWRKLGLKCLQVAEGDF